MLSSKTIILLLLLNLFTFGKCSGTLRNSKSTPTSGHEPEIANRSAIEEANDIEKTRQDFIRKVEDVYYVNNGDDGDYDDYVKKFNNYVSTNANAGYHTTPDSWTTDEWLVFALVLFLFGTIFCLGCAFCIIPCCCPLMGKSYVRMY